MEDGDDQTRTVAACLECGSVYAALELKDGKLRPIGSRDGCSCGSTSFADLEGADETVYSRDGEIDDEE